MMRDWWWPWWWSSVFDLGVAIAALVVASLTTRRVVRRAAVLLAAGATIAAVSAPLVMKQPDPMPARATIAHDGRLPKTAPEGSCLRRGSYMTTVFRPRFSFRVGDGWCYEQFSAWFSPFWWEEKPQFVIFQRPSKVYDAKSGRIVSRPKDFVMWLARHPRFVFERVTTQIGGVDATALDGTVKTEPTCLWPGIYPGKDQCVGASDQERVRIFVIRLSDGPLIVSFHGLIDRWDAFLPKAEALLRTISFVEDTP